MLVETALLAKVLQLGWGWGAVEIGLDERRREGGGEMVVLDDGGEVEPGVAGGGVFPVDEDEAGRLAVDFEEVLGQQVVVAGGRTLGGSDVGCQVLQSVEQSRGFGRGQLPGVPPGCADGIEGIGLDVQRVEPFEAAGVKRDDVIIVKGSVNDFFDILEENRGGSVTITVSADAQNQPLEKCVVRQVEVLVPKP